VEGEIETDADDRLTASLQLDKMPVQLGNVAPEHCQCTLYRVKRFYHLAVPKAEFENIVYSDSHLRKKNRFLSMFCARLASKLVTKVLKLTTF
jgi:hypothetical protein